jgi:hypothetical protein
MFHKLYITKISFTRQMQWINLLFAIILTELGLGIMFKSRETMDAMTGRREMSLLAVGAFASLKRQQCH